MSDKIKVFISYAREDYEYAKRLYNDLRKAGLDPWLDKTSIPPGKDWEIAIRQAIRESHFFLPLLSSRSVRKHGTVQREIKWALDECEKCPEGEISIIPMRLEECEPVYERLRALHWVDMFPSWDGGLDKILGHIITQPPEGREDLPFLVEVQMAVFQLADRRNGSSIEKKPSVIAKEFPSIEFRITVSLQELEGRERLDGTHPRRTFTYTSQELEAKASQFCRKTCFWKSPGTGSF
jgi:hypothetical protein